MRRLNSVEREPNTIYVASISYGKDSLAMLEAIHRLGYPLDRIVSVQVWATDTIPADLPKMYEWKAKADEIIYQKYGIRVERISAKNGGGCYLINHSSTSNYQREDILEQSKVSHKPLEVGVKNSNMNILTYENIFYKTRKLRKLHKKKTFYIYGFPMKKGNWCTNLLKTNLLDKATKVFLDSPRTKGDTKIVQYLGIASDEHIRIERHSKKENIVLPLWDIDWEEDYCGLWCSYNDLLSPTYINGTRDGCWFCHNQGVEQLRLLRKNYPNLWEILLKWDLDSPASFKSDGHTVHDYDKRFELEDKGIIKKDEPFFWKYLEKPPQRQITMFDILE